MIGPPGGPRSALPGTDHLPPDGPGLAERPVRIEGHRLGERIRLKPPSFSGVGVGPAGPPADKV